MKAALYALGLFALLLGIVADAWLIVMLVTQLSN